jgi:hypothetical protein
LGACDVVETTLIRAERKIKTKHDDEGRRCCHHRDLFCKVGNSIHLLTFSQHIKALLILLYTAGKKKTFDILK